MSNATLQVGGGNWAAQDGKLLGYAVEPTSGRYLAREFTVNRNSSKWVLGSDGYLYEVPADQPALEYYSDGTFRGALVEPQSVNEAKASEDLDNATYWALIRVTSAGDTETDPKGGTNSFLLSETVGDGTHDFVTQSVDRPSISSGETWTQSVFVKKGDGVNAPDIVQLAHNDEFGATNHANFDISVGGGTSGTVTDSSGGTGRIRYYGNGWYRISFTATSTSAGDAYFLLCFTNNNPTAGRRPSYTGQTDANVFVWGAQLEQSPIATSYIPTTTGAVTRLKDDIFFTNASSVIGQSEGTLFVEVDWQGESVQNQHLLEVSDGTASNRIIIVNIVSSDELRMFAQSNGSIETSQGESSTAYSGIQKIAFAYKQNDCELYRNGSSISTDTTVDLSSLGTLTDVEFQQGSVGNNQANMWIRDARIYNTRLTDTECQDLTNVESFNTEYLIVAGGGGGGNSQISNFPRAGGGGGAGGVLQGNISLTSSELFTVTVGDGGNGSTGDAAAGQSGENSVFASLTAIGGGGGGGSNADNAKNGGSGGGGGESQPAGTGTVGQGNNGGSGASDGGGGGGGAGSVGANGTEDNGGNGGSGIESTITGASVYYAGGGGGGGTSSGGNGGIGGGGNGGANANGSNATANTGGGGGGTGDATSSHYNGGNGGSGIVVIKYPSSLSVKYGTGLTFNTQTSGGYKITTFTSGTGQIAIQ